MAGLRVQARAGIFIFFTIFIPALELHQAVYSVVPELRWPKRGVNPLPSCAKAKNAWNFIFISSFSSWCGAEPGQLHLHLIFRCDISVFWGHIFVPKTFVASSHIGSLALNMLYREHIVSRDIGEIIFISK
jgi:hypothetical protein